MNIYRITLGVLFVSAASLVVVACGGSPSTSPGAQQTKGATPPPAVAGATLPAAPTASVPPTAAPSNPGYSPGTGPGYSPGIGSGSGTGSRGAGTGYGSPMGPGRGNGTSGPGGGMGPGMMGPGARSYNQNGSPLTMDQAVQIASQYISSAGNSDLQLASVHQFTNGFEAEYTEKGTGVHAFEILIDPYSGAAYPEMGPNVMWNTKYGGMGGMRGGPSASEATTKMPVSAEAAKKNAQQWLDANLQGTTLGSEVDTAYGYYDMMVEKDGKHYSQIDVNGYSGQVWYEDWQGPVVQSREIKGGQ